VAWFDDVVLPSEPPVRSSGDGGEFDLDGRLHSAPHVVVSKDEQ
jgi:hypothetical protein